MEARKRLYKAGPRDNPTLTERVKQNKDRRQNARVDKFTLNRKIPLSDSPCTPVAKQPNVSAIADRNKQLKAYRLQKNTAKLNQIQDTKSPFILAVPSGRWVEKKESVRPVRLPLNDTPVRNALMNERMLKKSTVKNLILKSTAKKENVVFEKPDQKPKALKSKKKILTELNAVQHSTMVADHTTDSDVADVLSPLNTTFEITPEKEVAETTKESNWKPEIDSGDVKEKVEQKSSTPKFKATIAVKTEKVKKVTVKDPIKKVVVVKPVARPARLKAVEPLSAKPTAPAASKFTVKSSAGPSKSTTVPTKTSATAKPVAKPSEAVVISKPATKLKNPSFSPTYTLYKSTLECQIKYIAMQLDPIISTKEEFFELLSEDQQTMVHQVVQQNKVLMSDKLTKFGELLDKYEADIARPDDPKRVTDDDVENYWYLIYDEIEKLKSDMSSVHEMKKNALATAQKKRRTRRTYIPEDGTPKRSRRIADAGETPKHNASCYGCVTMSASKVNTPRSVHKRRTTATGKKSVVFDSEIPTPKQSGRRSTKLHKATPRRNIMRMNAVDDDSELNIEDLN